MSRQSVNVLGVFFAIVLVVIFSGSVVRAEERVVSHVPFAFIVGETRLPAGDYLVKDAENDPGVTSITSTDGHRATFTLTIVSSSNDMTVQPGLVFEKFDDQYFLARVIGGDGDEREIMLTPAIMEREVVAAR
jgi:ABC-type lipoprotein release transport system permease subunit